MLLKKSYEFRWSISYDKGKTWNHMVDLFPSLRAAKTQLMWWKRFVKNTAIMDYSITRIETLKKGRYGN